VTDEQKAELIAALVRELEGYEKYGRKDRAAEVKKQLDAIGAEGKPPAKRATKSKKKSTKL
jgi:hypothetical protein